MAARNDDGLYAKARSLFISKATMDDLTGRATPRQTDAASRPFDTEPANGERSKRERLLRRARFPVVKSLDGYDFSNVRLPDGYALDGLLDLDFVPCAQDLVFYDKTGRGKTYLAIGLGMRAVERGLNCFASMFVRQVRQCFSVVWADGFPRCRHRFPVM